MDQGTIRAPQLNEGADILGNLAGNDPGPLGQLAMLLVRARPAFERAMQGMMGAPQASQGIAPIFAPVMTGKLPQPEGTLPHLISNLRAPGVPLTKSQQQNATLDQIKLAMGRMLSGRNPIKEADPAIRQEFQALLQRAPEAPGWWDIARQNPNMIDRRDRFQDVVQYPMPLPRFADYVEPTPNMQIRTGRRYPADSGIGGREAENPMLSMKSEAWYDPTEVNRNRVITDLIRQLDMLRQQHLWP